MNIEIKDLSIEKSENKNNYFDGVLSKCEVKIASKEKTIKFYAKSRMCCNELEAISDLFLMVSRMIYQLNITNNRYKCRLCGKDANHIKGYLKLVSPKEQPSVWECRPSCDSQMTDNERVVLAIENQNHEQETD